MSFLGFCPPSLPTAAVVGAFLEKRGADIHAQIVKKMANLEQLEQLIAKGF